MALGFAAFDAVGYDQGQVSVGPLKLGRFVKAAVLISPPPVNIPALRTPQVMRMPEICQRFARDDRHGQQEQRVFYRGGTASHPVHQGTTAGG